MDLLDQPPHLQMNEACLGHSVSLSRADIQLEYTASSFRLWTASMCSNWRV